MAIQKPGIPKGTRDFGPAEMSKRNFIFNTIKKVFRQHGYAQIETPAMENLNTLLGKYGEEGDKLLFKVLNSGNFLEDIKYLMLIPEDQKDEFSKKVIQFAEDVYSFRNIQDKDIFTKGYSTNKNADFLKSIRFDLVLSSLSINNFANHISGKGLRYDLTVPFARFVVQHQNEIQFPFKRFQIQPVWRADRPQKGRYREFYQCDVDVVGSNSLLNEVDLLQIIVEVFNKLAVNIKIKINNRKILAGIADYIGYPERITDITTAIDKFEKIGLENVNGELRLKGIDDIAINQLENVLFIQEQESTQKLQQLKSILLDSKTGLKGIEELSLLLDYCKEINIDSLIEFDLTLARGLNYYTGAIIEVKAMNVNIGSICGGGRYDDLTGIFGLKDISGVGVSFGADRIYDVMDQLNLFPAETVKSSKVMFVNFGAKEAVYCLPLLSKLHQANIASELYPDSVKLQKQMTYANAKNIQFVVLIGENEIKEGLLTVKNMFTGEQFKITIEELMEIVN